MNKGESSSDRTQPMDSLDVALHELGMLNTVTPARRQYLEEISCISDILQKNARYVTNVCWGRCIKPACEKNRVRPYKIPRQNEEGGLRIARFVKERHRTRSENADSPLPGLLTITPIVETVVDMAIDLAKQEVTTQTNNNVRIGIPRLGRMKKTKSLENVKIENDNASQPSHEMEFVSSRIQRLKMND